MAAEVKTPCTALIVRYVHDPRTAELLNIGVLLLCSERDYLGARFLRHWGRITTAFPDADPVHLRRIARSFERACEAWITTTATQRALARAEDLVAFANSVVHPDDGSITFSPLISGVTSDPARTLNELFALHVDRYVPHRTGVVRDDLDVWRSFLLKLARPEIVARIQPHTIETPHYKHTFEHAWLNGKWNVAQPISLDLRDPDAIREKAARWTGRVITLQPKKHDTELFMLVGMPRLQRPNVIMDAANDAVEILRENLESLAVIVPESESERLAEKMLADLASKLSAEAN